MPTGGEFIPVTLIEELFRDHDLNFFFALSHLSLGEKFVNFFLLFCIVVEVAFSWVMFDLYLRNMIIEFINGRVHRPFLIDRIESWIIV